MPGTVGSVKCAEHGSWCQLETSLRGSGTATTTTLLSALWPDDHHILDWRVLAAVAGPAIALGEPIDLDLPEPGSREQMDVCMQRYGKVRKLLSDLANDTDLPLVTVERALYRLTVPVKGKGKTWHQYGDELKKRLDRPPAQTAQDDGTPDDEGDMSPQAP